MGETLVPGSQVFNAKIMFQPHPAPYAQDTAPSNHVKYNVTLGSWCLKTVHKSFESKIILRITHPIPVNPRVPNPDVSQHIDLSGVLGLL